MENNKYYTPSIEEFHAGFEYEIYEPNYEVNSNPCMWKPQTFEEYTFDSEIETIDGEMPFSCGIYEGIIRVKYLDIEDLESLGFKQIDTSWFNGIKEDKHIQLSLGYVQDDKGSDMLPLVTIYHMDIIFNGIVKNKAELKNILKMINVKY